ncbi:MAG TPA: response regulator transcription factor [Candidatus Dormibacteraeota bacterium]|nr:response regulator transcription factor [Candidatus Dormibacteraeota bacterium]
MIRIAIVDDHEMVREGLRTILHAEPDFDVVAETGLGGALPELVEQAEPDIVLLDAHLPDVSGPEVCRRLRASHPGVKVIIVTTYSDDDLVDECIDAGARGFVVKDVERFSLKQSIRAVHRGEGAIAPAIAGRILERIRAQKTSPQTPPRTVLTAVQTEILRRISEGFSNREIAHQVHLSENTVKTHIQEIFHRLEVHNRVEAAIRATKEGLI